MAGCAGRAGARLPTAFFVQIVIIFVDRKCVVNVGDASLRVPFFEKSVPKNGGVGGHAGVRLPTAFFAFKL